eukprot:Skav208084  [mRNA]  locus=scaffold1681:52346:52573:+ [translate_table: standard]
MSDVICLMCVALLGRSAVDLQWCIIAAVVPPTSKKKPQKEFHWIYIHGKRNRTCIPGHDSQLCCLNFSGHVRLVK